MMMMAEEEEEKSPPPGRPGTANPAAANQPIQPLTPPQLRELLRLELLFLEEKLAGANAAADPKFDPAFDPSKASSAINVRFNYAISVPYAAPNAHLTSARWEAKPEDAASAGADAAAADADKKGGGGDKGALGSFCRAALYDGPACLREILKAHPSSAHLKDLVQATPLHKAVANGDMRALRLLLGSGADIDSPNLYGDAPIHRAIENSRLLTVTELLRHGADVDRPNKKGDTPLHLACATGHSALVRALLQAGAVAMSPNLKGMFPLHTAIHCGQRKVLEALMSYHTNRKLALHTLCVEKTNDTPLHVAVRSLRVNDLVWMVEYGGFGAGLVMKNMYNQDPLKLLKECKKLLGAMNKYAKKAAKAAKGNKPAPPVPAKIIMPPQNLPLPEGNQREMMNAQLPGQTQPYLLDGPTYVKFHTTPLPPPEPVAKKAKKGKGGGKKGKKEKVVPPPAFQLPLAEALARLDGKGGPKIEETLQALAKKYDEEKKAAEKVAAEKAKAKAAADKEAKAAAAKGGKKGK